MNSVHVKQHQQTLEMAGSSFRTVNVTEAPDPLHTPHLQSWLAVAKGREDKVKCALHGMDANIARMAAVGPAEKRKAHLCVLLLPKFNVVIYNKWLHSTPRLWAVGLWLLPQGPAPLSTCCLLAHRGPPAEWQLPCNCLAADWMDSSPPEPPDSD